MKRMFSLLLALVLLLAVFPLDSSKAECSHPTTTTYVEVGFINNWDSSYHYGGWQLVTRCALCSEFIEQHDSGYKGFPHTYGSDGYCTDCGYRKSCTHASTSVLCDSYDRRPLNDEQHELVQHMYTYCVDCGEKLNTYDDIEILEHEFWGDSCHVCGFQRTKVCKHTNTQTYSLYTEYTPIEGNDKQHNHINHEKIACADCGEVINADKTSHLRSSHSFNNNNKCAQCGYQKDVACKHVNTNTRKINTEYKKIDGDDKQHRVVNHMQTTCEACGYIVKEDEEQYQVADHNFSNGMCTSCGYEQFACTHDRTYKTYTTDPEYAKYDEKQHYKTRYYNLICSRCDKVLEENIKNAELQNHSLDGLGTCRYCNYNDIAKCKHWNTTDKIIEKQSYRSYSKTEHRVKGIGVVTCDDCGVVEEENAEVEVKEYHTYNSQGVCIYCGQQIEILSHEERTGGGTSVLIPQRGGTYQRTPTGLFLFDWTVSSNVEWIQLSTSGGKPGDSFTYTVSENTGAERCGYITTTPEYSSSMVLVVIQEGETEVKAEIHPTLSGFSVSPTSVTLGDSITVTGTVNGNGAKLTAVSIGVRNLSNEGLGGYWGRNQILNADSFDLSSFGSITLDGNFGNTAFESGEWIVEVYATNEDGLGFVQSHSQIITIGKPACRHDNAQRVETGEVIYSNLTETHHDAQYAYHLICPTCSAIVDTGYYEAKAEEHDFSQSDKCACGAQKPEPETCNHDAYTPQDVYIDGSEPVFEDTNNGATHLIKGRYNRYCGNCGEWLSEVLDNGTPEAHNYEDDGVCICSASCLHVNFKDYPCDTIAPKYDNITETTHDVYLGFERICDDCGQPTGVTGHFETPQTVEHIFNDGACACSAKAPTPETCTDHDFNNSKCKKCGFSAYIILSRDSVKVGETITLSTNLPEGDYTFTVSKNLSLIGSKATALAAGKGNIYLYYKNRGGTVASCSVTIECKEHFFNPEDNYKEVTYAADIGNHTVIITTYGKCACGYSEAIDILFAIEGHVDKDGNLKCDQCEGTAYYTLTVEHILEYSRNDAHISQEFLDSLEYHIDNIAFEENTFYYGGFQESPRYNELAVKEILIKHGVISNDGFAGSNIAETLSILFSERQEEYEIDEYLKLVNSTGCFYTALSNTIFDIFEGKEDDFFEHMGFPMYYEGHLNFDAVLVDFYCFAHAQSKENAFGIVDSWKANAWIEYTKHAGVNCSIPEVTTGEGYSPVTIEYIENCFKNGIVPVVGLIGDYDLLDQNGNVVLSMSDSRHAVTITGIYKNYVVVSSWGHAYLMDLNQVNNALAGTYSIEYSK